MVLFTVSVEARRLLNPLKLAFFFCFVLKKYLFILYEYTVAVFKHTRGGHQMPIADGCEPPCGCWELNSGPLEEQSVLLTAEPSLQPLRQIFNQTQSSLTGYTGKPASSRDPPASTLPLSRAQTSIQGFYTDARIQTPWSLF